MTPVPSADGQFWDIQDTSPWAQDSGGIATGGRANPFNGFGYLKLQVRRAGGDAARCGTTTCSGFGLAHDGVERFDSITPVLHGRRRRRARDLRARRDTNYLRYFDSFTNTADEDRVVEVAWGGAAGAYDDGGQVAVATTSSGDRRIDPTDSFVTVMQNARGVADPMRGPVGARTVGARARHREPPALLTRVGDMYGDPFVDTMARLRSGPHRLRVHARLRPGQTTALVTFVVKGLSEVYDPRGGFPVARQGRPRRRRSDAVYAGADAEDSGGRIGDRARHRDGARSLSRSPDLRGLTPRQRAQIVELDAAGGGAAAAVHGVREDAWRSCRRR